MKSATKAPTSKPSGRSAAREAWELIFELFSRYKPTMLAIQDEYGLRPPMVFALKELDDPKPMGRLAEILHCDGSNITWITDRLEERGYAERLADPKDRRVRLIALTDDGRRVRDEIDARLGEPPPELHALSEPDLRALRDILSRALEGAEEKPAP
jgi:DNA-binding MarR family transcriptional regulator